MSVFRRSTWGLHTTWFDPEAVVIVSQDDPVAVKLTRRAVRVRRFPTI